METGKKIYIRDITKIEKKWLLEYAGSFYKLDK
jgi:ATP-dependent RNA helicase DDX35